MMVQTAPASRRRIATGEPMPRHVDPMLALLSASMPARPEEYGFEFKWDGVRAICYWDGRHIELRSRNDLEITARYPELHPPGKMLRGPAVLDGEVVALDEADRPSFAQLQRRMHVTDKSAVVRLMREVPVLYVLFDVLYSKQRNHMSLPYTQRRELLEEMALSADHWQLTPAVRGKGDAMLDAARKNGLEGVVAKRLTSIYQPGRRSPEWLKIKIIQRQEFVIGGWIPEQTGRKNRVGALLIGYYDSNGLRYAGNVGTGFTGMIHEDLTRRFAKLGQGGQAASPFADRVPSRGVNFLKPSLVAEIEYRRWPQLGRVQQGAFKGLRMDKPARQVVREDVLPLPVLGERVGRGPK
jgi:bifunctional non-homologous end joining protein LigD